MGTPAFSFVLLASCLSTPLSLCATSCGATGGSSSPMQGRAASFRALALAKAGARIFLKLFGSRPALTSQRSIRFIVM
jgi:hypothetical protein